MSANHPALRAGLLSSVPLDQLILNVAFHAALSNSVLRILVTKREGFLPVVSNLER